MRGYVIGEKVTLTGNPEPCMIPRPYQWERGGSMPKKYQRTAEKMVRESDKQTYMALNTDVENNGESS